MADPDFIEVLDGALDSDVCRTLLQRFEASGQAVRGSTGSGVDLRLKDSWDIRISGRREWADAERALNIAALTGLKHYVRKYAHAVLAPLHLQMPDPATGELVMLNAEHVATLVDGVLDQLVFRVFRPGSINLQKYTADQGGYPYWHCELYPRADNSDALHRVVLWTIYLNEGFRGGETEFLYQNRRIAPKTGSLLIAPTAFTHTHRGNMPRGEDKYIATSWILFNRADQLYANPR
jgi:hypothetical protein